MRAQELDKRREVGVIFRHTEAVKKLLGVFRQDWKASGPAKDKVEESVVAAAPKKIAKAVQKQLPVRRVVDRFARVAR